MAQHRIAQLIAAQMIGTHTRLLEFASEDELGFVGGQYIIVQTGISIGADKTAKRAYSLLSSDEEQRRFQIAVRRVESGPGSNFMLALPLGAVLSYSGPWGKFLPANETPQSALIVATDTGITAAMGLVTSKKFLSHRERARMFWLREREEYFLPESFVREQVEGKCNSFEIIQVPSDGDERKDWLTVHKDQFISRMLEQKHETAFLCGDGVLLSRFRDALLENAADPFEIRVETFFHHQEMKFAVNAVSV